MSKLLNTILIAFIIFIFCISSFAYATEINMNLTSNSTPDAASNDDATSDNSLDSESLTPQDTHINNSATVSTLSNLPEANLGLTNILNIVLIVIGILLILLAIAIIIRLKH